MAGTSGTINELEALLTDLRADSGMMTSAGLIPCGVEKNVAVNVVLNGPV